MNENRTGRPHAIMFHHFYDEKHIKGQGAISATQLESIIEYCGDNLLSAKAWFDRAKTNSLNNKDVCLSFDDSLLCQYEIALPVLDKYDLTAFWFVYSSVLNGGTEKLEIYRKFRTISFSDIESFYERFFLEVNNSSYCKDVELSLKHYSHDNWKYFPYYTQSDTKFRYVRDSALGPEKYDHVMDMIMQDHTINMDEFTSDLWMNVEHIQEINDKGHIIGLHSHTHPTQLSKLSAVEQEREYQTNFDFLYSALGKKTKTVSHPCNSYNKQTLSILSRLGIELGFRANMENHKFSMFEFPREDHANVIRRIQH